MVPGQSRYKVVEQGRRLVTIDTATGAEVGAKPAPPNPPAAVAQSTRTPPNPWGSSTPKPTRFFLLSFFATIVGQQDGGVIISTTESYDPGGPRTVRLSATQASQLNGVWLIGLLLIILPLFLGFLFDFMVGVIVGIVLFRTVLPLGKKATKAILDQGEQLE